MVLIGGYIGYTACASAKLEFEHVKLSWLRALLISIVTVTLTSIAIAVVIVTVIDKLTTGADTVTGDDTDSRIVTINQADGATITINDTTGVIGIEGSAGPYSFAIAVCIFSAIFHKKNANQIAQFWFIFTLIVSAVFSILSVVIIDQQFAWCVLFLVFLPLVNAPLDWISLGVTRGLFSQILNGPHRSLKVLSFLLIIDVILALCFLFAVFAGSFLVYRLFEALSPESSYSANQLVDIVSSEYGLAIGIWLVLASTLVPTFLHFLVALAAFVSLPFSHKRAEKTANQLQVARDKVLKLEKKDANQAARDVQVHVYARRWAIAYIFAPWPVVIVLWLALVSFLSYVIYIAVQPIFRELLLLV